MFAFNQEAICEIIADGAKALLNAFSALPESEQEKYGQGGDYLQGWRACIDQTSERAQGETLPDGFKDKMNDSCQIQGFLFYQLNEDRKAEGLGPLSYSTFFGRTHEGKQIRNAITATFISNLSGEELVVAKTVLGNELIQEYDSPLSFSR